MEFHGNQVFITGITSPLGREISALLIKAGVRVAGLIRTTPRSLPIPENVEIIGGECQNPKEYREHVLSSSHVIHAAGLHFSSEIIRSCAGQGRLQRIVFISSMRMKYPDSLLSRTEKAGKRLLLEKESEISASRLPWTILRPALIYACGDRSFSKVRRFMAARRFFPLPGRGDALRQPISARDLAASTVQALLSQSTNQKKYDLPGEKISVREILETMNEEMGLHAKLIHVPELPVKMSRKACDFFGLDRYGSALMSFLRWYHGFDWRGDAAAEDFGHCPRSFRQNMREQIAHDTQTRESARKGSPR